MSILTTPDTAQFHRGALLPQVSQERGTIHLYVPILRYDPEKGIAEGYCFVNEVVDGEGGIRLKRSAMEEATRDYLRFGAVREMHQPHAAGTASPANDEERCGVFWDQKGAYLRALVVDPVAKEKCRTGVYKGFSVGVRPTLMRGKDVDVCRWAEVSLVDRPKDPDALFSVYRAAVTGEEEIRMEPQFKVGDRVRVVGTEEVRVSEDPKCCEATVSEVLVRADGVDYLLGDNPLPLPESCLERVAAEPETIAGGEESEAPGTPVAEERAETAGEPADGEPAPVDRGLTSEEVPSRENLEGGAETKLHGVRHFDCGSRTCHGHLQHAAAVRCQEAREGAAERGEVAELHRCGGCGCPVTGGAEAVYPFLAEQSQSMTEVQILSFEDRLNPAVRQANFRQAFQALSSSLFEISLYAPGDKEAQAREAIGQFADFVAPLVAGDAEERRALFASLFRGDTRAAVKKLVADVPEGQGFDAYLSPDEKQIFCSWGDWADGEVMDRTKAALTELLGADNVEFDAEAPGPEGWTSLRGDRASERSVTATLFRSASTDPQAVATEAQAWLTAYAAGHGVELERAAPADTTHLQADLTRLEATNTDLLQRLSTLESELTTERTGRSADQAALDTATEEIARLEKLPADGRPVRYGAMDRTFAANELLRGPQADTSALLTEYHDLQRTLKGEPDADRKNQGLRRLFTLQDQLRAAGHPV